jgi:hypothetical protein
MVLGGAKMDAIPTEPLTWMTFHRMRFHKGIDANERRFDGPLGATYTLLGPDSRLDENGMRTTVSDVWGVWPFTPINGPLRRSLLILLRSSQA